ncbi:MAG: ribokinase [Pseudomonadota bacterium]
MIIVFGSLSMDMNIHVPHMPVGKEPVISPQYLLTPGGRGGNQALAAARVGGKVALVGRVGDDDMGQNLLDFLRKNGVMVSGVARSDMPTGCAIVLRDNAGHNQMIVTSGANAETQNDQVPDEILTPQNFVLVQMELKLEETVKLLERAHARGTKTILNLAPAIMIPKAAVQYVDYLIVNSIEGRKMAERMGLSVEDSATKLAYGLARAGNMTVIMTLGKHGSIAVQPDGRGFEVPILEIGQETVVDVTGAGDCYTGTLAGCLQEGRNLLDSMKLASIAGTLACQKVGAQASYPYFGYVEERLSELANSQAFQL